MLLFALSGSRRLGEDIASALGTRLASHEERDFEDGEHKSRPLVTVRGREVFVIQSLFSEPGQSVNDKIVRLLFFIAALKGDHAARVSAVIPYFAYARKDRRTKARDPLGMQYMARLLEAAGADHVMSLDIHNLAAFENAFRIPTDHLEARALFAPRLAELAGEQDVVVVSPDAGGIKRAESLRESLGALLGREAGRAYMEKSRSGGELSGELLVGELRGRCAILVDDIVSSGATLLRAVEALQTAGAARILAAATHGLFVGDAPRLTAHPALEKLLVSDSVPPFRLPEGEARDKVEVLSSAEFIAAAIGQIHEEGSLTQLQRDYCFPRGSGDLS